MKQLKSLVIAAIAFLGTFQMVHAQAKIAHVDVQTLMQGLPAMKDAQSQLEKLSNTYDSEYKVMVEEYQNKIRKYEQEADKVDNKTNEDRARELQDMQKRIVDYRDNAQRELQKKEQDLMQPLMDKIKKSIEKVGKAKGFQYVMNKADFILAEGTDLTADVKKDLGF